MTSRAPLIVAVVLLLLLVLYVGSYLALVVPGGFYRTHSGRGYHYRTFDYCRLGGEWSNRVYFPLHLIDRKVRPGAWDQQLGMPPVVRLGPPPTP
ncbi:hypothetical protein NA78x_001733 [Anatilimnocola sp. NA78]|uniref:hypothetical protein n=1 Tax=Anatilimnocola sp. NA78 TaxID=3415683 RepID=UPI003CE4C7F0